MRVPEPTAPRTLLCILGAPGIGKNTICRELLTLRPGSAWVDSDWCRQMNPFALDDGTIPTIRANITALLGNYLACPAVRIVIFSYGLHGRRSEVFAGVLAGLAKGAYMFAPVVLLCEAREAERRMRADGRDEERIRRALVQDADVYAGLTYPRLDITHLTPRQAALAALRSAGLAPLQAIG